MPPPRKWKAELKTLDIETALCPRHILYRNAFNEIRARVSGEVILEIGDRAERQAGTGRKKYVAEVGFARQHRLCSRKRRIDERPSSPFAMTPLNEVDPLERPELGMKCLERRSWNPAVDVNCQWTAGRVPMACYRRSAIESFMHEHEDPKSSSHAQLPVDMRPSISSCRQFRYRSDQGVWSDGESCRS